MQRLEDAAIPMEINLNSISNLYPEKIDFEGLLKEKPLVPFSELTIEFLNDLSKELANTIEIREFPDVATFGFFCRKGNIISLRKKHLPDNLLRLGRGIVFHIAPSNVPVNFAYSLVCGILSGNINIVRVPSKLFRQVELIIDAIKHIGKKEQFREITDKIILVRYDRNSSATKYFSSICDVRVIWGGDETISKIRENPLSPRAFDITFADRYSLCLINADKYIGVSNKVKIANDFYNDTYLFDQNACTSPHLVVWTGDKKRVTKAQELFWKELHNILLLKKYVVQPIIAVDKLTALYNQCILGSNIHKFEGEDNLIWRANMKELDENIQDYRCSSGYFSEYNAASIFEISKIINRKYQTLAYFGFEKHELSDFILQQTPNGIDRIVPIGRTSEFSLVWDGLALMNSLSRIIELK
jgi:hypothetical protein